MNDLVAVRHMKLMKLNVLSINNCCPQRGAVVQWTTLDCESLCLSDETVKAVGPFYLVSMPGEVKDPTQGVNV